MQCLGPSWPGPLNPAGTGTGTAQQRAGHAGQSILGEEAAKGVACGEEITVEHRGEAPAVITGNLQCSHLSFITRPL